MDNEKLFWKIFKCKNEDELNNLVQEDKVLNDESNWYPYGGKDKSDKSNFGIFENQQSNPIPALIEKVTNSIDSLLLKKCRLLKIDPKSKQAPQTMSEAVELFFDIKNGDFSEISQSGRRDIAEDIQVIAEGDKQSPNILIYDNGEGQDPTDFTTTFLSLSRCNKTDIPFVQGKYNMGSTGAVIFCGEYRYQLIASKLYKEFAKHKENSFGFTIVRKHPIKEDEEKYLKSSWYEYLTIDEEIPKFNIQSLDLGLYKRKFETGSLIKLYSYNLPKGSGSSIVWNLWRDLNQFLYHPALPFIVYEKRKEFEPKTPSKLILGNKLRLVLDERGKKEKTITLSIIDTRIGEVPIEVHVLKPEVDQKEFINDKAVVFTQNGQVHGGLRRSFISQALGFSLLKDSVLVHVNCTGIKTSFRQDLFKGSRDRLNEGSKTELLIDKITVLLKENDDLKKLNQLRKNRILRESTEDKEMLESVLNNIPLENDIIKLLANNFDFNIFIKHKTDFKDISSGKEKKEKEHKPISKRFPSIFKINLPEDDSGRKIKSIPLNGKGVINFETDVEDEYLFRPKEKGELEIIILDYNSNTSKGGTKAVPTRPEELFNITKVGPSENSIKITFEPKTNLSVGDEIKLNAKLTSPEGALESIFWVKIIEKKKETGTTKPEKTNKLSPPMPIRVFETAENENDKTWKEYNWDGQDIVKLVSTQAEKDKLIIEAIAVNMDSYPFKRFLSKNKIKDETRIRFLKNKYFIEIYLHSLFLYTILDKMKKDETDIDLDPDEIIPKIFKPYANFLLSSFVFDDIDLSKLKED